MFKKIDHTSFKPKNNVLVWDGDCGFCKFWKTRWERQTGKSIQFKTYQSTAKEFKDVPLKEFKKASRLIETDGKIYSGPDSAYRSLWHADNKKWHYLYTRNKLFASLSDRGYNHIAKNRSFYFKLTRFLFGTDPMNFKPYWLFYLGIIIVILILIA